MLVDPRLRTSRGAPAGESSVGAVVARQRMPEVVGPVRVGRVVRSNGSTIASQMAGRRSANTSAARLWPGRVPVLNRASRDPSSLLLSFENPCDRADEFFPHGAAPPPVEADFLAPREVALEVAVDTSGDRFVAHRHVHFVVVFERSVVEIGVPMTAHRSSTSSARRGSILLSRANCGTSIRARARSGRSACRSALRCGTEWRV